MGGLIKATTQSDNFSATLEEDQVRNFNNNKMNDR